MLSYISTTRRKSCQACVKAKRRCDLGFPRCKRCIDKSLDCKYKSAGKLSKTEVAVQPKTPEVFIVDDFSKLDHTSGTSSTSSSSSSPFHNIIESIEADLPDLDWDNVDLTFNPSLFNTSSDSSTPGSSPSTEPLLFPTELNCRTAFEHSPQDLRLVESLMPGGDPCYPSYLNDSQVLFLVTQLLTFPYTLARTGSTPFMHPSLWSTTPPDSYIDACGLAAFSLLRTEQTRPILLQGIAQKIQNMRRRSSNWAIDEHLAAVQALIIYQIIRLFNPDLTTGPQIHKDSIQVAERDNTLLELWAALLWKRFFHDSSPSHTTPSQKLIFDESLRRTVLLSVFVRGVYGCVRNGGICYVVPILLQMPVAVRKDMRVPGWAAVEDKERGVVAYEYFSHSWPAGRGKVEELSVWERLLLGACRGGEDPRLVRC